jgi:hypothetical protein
MGTIGVHEEVDPFAGNVVEKRAPRFPSPARFVKLGG